MSVADRLQLGPPRFPGDALAQRESDRERYAAAWDESKHPRADDGKFGEGGGGGRDSGGLSGESETKAITKACKEFTKHSRMAPCAPVAVIMREQGKGKVGYGEFKKSGRLIGHYFNIGKDGKIFDATANYYDIDPQKDIKVLGTLRDDERPPLIGDKDYDWWRERIAGNKGSRESYSLPSIAIRLPIGPPSFELAGERERYAKRALKSSPGQKSFGWEEEDHPRDDSGEFTRSESGGSVATADSPSETEPEPEQPEPEKKQEVEFTPAKTTKEAEDFAVKTGLAKKVNYGKVSVEYANVVNKRLVSLVGKHGVPFHEIKTVNKRTHKGAEVQMTAIDRYDPDGNYTGTVLQINGGAHVWFRHNRNAINKRYGTDIQETDTELEILEKWNAVDDGQLAVPGFAGNIAHEYGHCLTAGRGTIKEAKRRALYATHLGDRSISKYAGTNGYERLAETFAAWSNDPSSVSQENIDFFNKYSVVPIGSEVRSAVFKPIFGDEMESDLVISMDGEDTTEEDEESEQTESELPPPENQEPNP